MGRGLVTEAHLGPEFLESLLEELYSICGVQEIQISFDVIEHGGCKLLLSTEAYDPIYLRGKLLILTGLRTLVIWVPECLVELNQVEVLLLHCVERELAEE